LIVRPDPWCGNPAAIRDFGALTFGVDGFRAQITGGAVWSESPEA
jgi:hypothetical protein